MSCIEYINLSEVNATELLLLLNKNRIREHLVEHQLFTSETIASWVEEKNQVDSFWGCRVRAIHVDKRLAGWCGIQQEGERYEIAIVLDNEYWGLGRKVFREIMLWAREFGHKTVFIHFLHTRPAYEFLRKISKTVSDSELLGSKFTTYELEVDKIA